MEQTLETRLEMSDFVGFWKRILVSLLDFIILAIPAYYLSRWSLASAENYNSLIPLLLEWVALAAFNIFMVVKYGGTPGRLLLKTRIVNGSGAYPTVKQSVIRYSLYLINSLLAVVITSNEKMISSLSGYFSDWANLNNGLNEILGLIIIADCLIIVVTRYNRALHDMMAGTYVVNKAALDELK
ncbi:hypothetical protein BSK56_27805 [Paenibacillus borealis]|uniref:RDD domain-containing protein n=1 Tax=Paenibacillus borealis TaxID=160799 RepID=A0ABX3GZE2_PAEBO|nr:RDD family protein [Paenibacillus borealis]OMD41266.1 hypothetical protein BSK56_27805 [Paenibacillus borealis]